MIKQPAVCAWLATALMIASAPVVEAPTLSQWTPDNPGSDNIEVVSHLPLGPRLSVADIEIEQEMHRPFLYIARMVYGPEGEKGTDIIIIADPAKPEVIYRWRIENQDLHLGNGGMDLKYFKWNDRYYLVQSVQFDQGGPDSAMGAVVLDVTGLPDPSTVREVARIQAPEQPRGVHNIFVHAHSNGRVLLYATTEGYAVNVYDLGDVVEDRPAEALIGTVPAGPGDNPRASYHDMYVAYHVDSGQDRFYGAGTGGYFVYDVTDVANPELLVSLTQIEGVKDGHTFTADPHDPVTVAYYDTYVGPLNTDVYPTDNGAFGIDVRNADGLIVISDMTTGFWAFRMDGFLGWNGADWGVPDISSVQTWPPGRR